MEKIKQGLNHKTIQVDFCVVGGGISGMMAAIRAARLGVKVALIHERPVYGGNASNEVRMWICGVKDYAYKETGILEEIHLENYYFNPHKNYYIWNALLNHKVEAEKNITSLLNTTCFDATMDGSRIISVTGYQMTTQTLWTIKANVFADCSGDSILAPLTHAKFMYGREGQDDYHEEMKGHSLRDDLTMGNSLLIQARELPHKVSFIAPDWAEKVSVEKLQSKGVDLKSHGENFWYIELGGVDKVIEEAENINKRLLALCFGIWDTIKNSGVFNADNFDLDFVGFLPAKRESRRMLGDYVMTGNDILSSKRFDDAVAYGGWPMDDHNPKGFDGEVANFYTFPSQPYQIPYRTLYSQNVSNLFFAGRNISLTHMANSSARVMGTCATLGEAVGAAAFICKKYDCLPKEVGNHMDLLQQTLLFHDAYIPWVKRKVADLSLASDFNGPEVLRNGQDRNLTHELQSTEVANGTSLIYQVDNKLVKNIKIVFDSDLLRETFKGISECEKHHSMRANHLLDSPTMFVPLTLAKEYVVRIKTVDNQWKIIKKDTRNLKRNVVIPVNKTVKAVELTVHKNWGDTANTNIFTFEIK